MPYLTLIIYFFRIDPEFHAILTVSLFSSTFPVPISYVAYNIVHRKINDTYVSSADLYIFSIFAFVNINIIFAHKTLGLFELSTIPLYQRGYCCR